jgi:two-component system CheB/CheR fusion protein
LGLAIVRYVVAAHGGSVEVESGGRGQGATFTVFLPLMMGARPPCSERELIGQRGARSLREIRILVVEDDEGTREALTEMLGTSGSEVRSASSAASAMREVEEFRPELLVCDIAMPDEDGYSLLRRIRALGSEHGGDVPALALTALASEEDRRQAFEAGFRLHLAKPVDSQRLSAALAALLEQSVRRAPQDRPST